MDATPPCRVHAVRGCTQFFGVGGGGDSLRGEVDNSLQESSKTWKECVIDDMSKCKLKKEECTRIVILGESGVMRNDPTRAIVENLDIKTSRLYHGVSILTP